MKKIMLAGAALLSFTSVATIAAAQDHMAPGSRPPGDAMTSPANPPASAQPAMPANPPEDADPNAAQPVGAVPADPGMRPAPAGIPKNPAAPVGSASNPVTVGGNLTPPPTEAREYPPCSRTVQDSCVNRREARTGRKPR